MAYYNEIRAYYETEFGPLGETDSNGWVQTRCPFHRDSNPSLGVNLKTGGFNCFACEAKGSMEVFHMKRHNVDLETACSAIAKILDPVNEEAVGSKIVATHDYFDADGKRVFQVCRLKNKKFVQRRPSGNGGWIGNIKGVKDLSHA